MRPSRCIDSMDCLDFYATANKVVYLEGKLGQKTEDY